MASPQVKNGYTRVANEILENIIKTNLNGTQYRLVMLIWRYTYGFKRTSHDMSVSFMAEKINASRSQVDRELTSLVDKHIIKPLGIGKKGARILSFNKNYEEWLNSEEKSDKNKKEDKPKKESNQMKKTTKKKPKYDEENTYYKMAVYFHKLVSTVAKDAGVEHLIKKANLQTWANDFRLLVEKDGVDKRFVKEVMDWATKDSFWKTNILSARKLREKFTELAIKMKATQKPKKQNQPVSIPKDYRDKDIEFQKHITAGGDPSDFNWS